ncbi:MAG: ATP-binding protein [Paracoccaceae bacterium]
MPVQSAIKRYLPKSLFWRAFLILVIPILVLQAVVALVFIQRHYDGVTAQMASSVAREINYAIRAVERADDAATAEAALEEMVDPLGLQLGLDLDGRITARDVRAFYDLTGSVIAETLARRVERPLALDFVKIRKFVDVRVATSKGVLRVLVPRGRMNASNPHQLLVWMAVTVIALLAVSTAFLRNQVRPIRELARAASAFGRGRSLPFRPTGAEEVRRAGHAFLAMRARIERQIGQRTLLLSGVSHDLRTPLTRMKLALACAEPAPETVELSRDLDEMERMLAAYLDFARGDGTEEAEPVDPTEIAREVAEDAGRDGVEVELAELRDEDQPGEIVLRRGAVKRCLGNLVGNAARHGARTALSVRVTARFVEYVVEDDGPGIPPERREEALRPFVRLDESRNQNQGAGVGLGLAIALDIARSHGGSLSLDASERLGGLRATLILPC